MIGPDTFYCTPNTIDYWDPDPSLVTCGNLYSLFLYFQLSIRANLNMYALFDCINVYPWIELIYVETW